VSNYLLTYKPFGDSAVLIEWPKLISIKILNNIRQFAIEIEKQNNQAILDISYVYSSLLIIYDVNNYSFQKAVPFLKSVYKSTYFSKISVKSIWQIPVCYDVDFGIDLGILASEKKLLIQEIISLHTSCCYTVYGIGFLPGFLYLGGLTEKLHLPRRSTPRLDVPKGSVAIGGNQTGIYPQNSPGGWHIIGRTPVSMFKVKNDVPCHILPGDEIKFEAISREEYDSALKTQKIGAYKLKNISND
jgi:inhibitor of KinA